MTVVPAVRNVSISAGVRLQYVEQGEPDGVPVILLHGLSDSWRSYELVLPHLPDLIHAFALSQRGHGDSDRPASGYRSDDFAADVAAFMDAMGLPSAVVVGHSMGSLIARQFANDFPERVRGLVLVGALQGTKQNPDMAAFRDELQRLEDPIDPTFAREFQESTLIRPIPPDYLETVVAESVKVPAHVWKASISGIVDHEPPAPTIDAVPPTLIVWGDGDLYTLRPNQDALLAMFPGSRLLVYEGTGHALQWEDPERFAADLVDFVESIAR